MKERGKGTRKLGEEGHLPHRDKALSLDREEADAAHGKMAVYKGTEGNPVLE